MINQLVAGAVAGSWPAAIALCVIAISFASTIVGVTWLFFHAFD